MDRRPYSIEKLFSIQENIENIEYKQTTSSYRESLTKILEALYIQKIKETNSDYLSLLSFNEILNLPSLVSESIFNALVSEPREYIKLEEFVEGLTFLFDKNIDFEYNEKSNIPKIYEILYKIFCLKKTKEKNQNNNNNDVKSRASSNTLNYNNLSSSRNNSNYVYNFNYVFDIEAFNKIISNILLVFYINANNFKIDEFLPFCEEIKLIVKKTFTINNNKNVIFNNNSNNSNINLNITSYYNNSKFPTFLANQNNLNIKSCKENEEEISCSNLNINLNLNNNFDTNMNLNMNMQNNVKMNLNLNMNINNISTISENLNKTNNQCTQCKLCMNCSKLNASSNNNLNCNQKNILTLEDFIECLQKNSKLLFILLFLIYSLSPINQKLIYLLMKNPNSKIIDDECDFQEEDEKIENIQSIPDSVKKVNLEEIRTNSRIMSENNSVNDSFDSISNLNVNNNIKNKIERNSSINSQNSNSSKLSNSNFIVNNIKIKNNNCDKENEEKNLFEDYNKPKDNNYVRESPSKGKIVFDLSEDTDSFSNLNGGNTYNNINNSNNNSNLHNFNRTNSNFNKSESNNNINNSKTTSQNASSSNLNNFTNKSKFFNTRSLFDKNNTNNNNLNDSNNNVIYNAHADNEIEENIEDEKSKITNVNSSTNNNFYYNHLRKESLSGYNSDSCNVHQKSKFSKGKINVCDYSSDGEIIKNKNNKININNNLKSHSNVNNNKNSNIQVNNNVINFNLDDDSSTFSRINSLNNNNQNNNSISNSNLNTNKNLNNNNNENNNKNTNYISNENKKSTSNNINIISYNLKNENSESHIIVYRHDKTNESSEYTNNNLIFDSKFKNSFDNIIVSNREENNIEKNENTNVINNVFSEFSRINTKNSLYNDFNDFLFEKNRINNSNNQNNKNFNFSVSRSRSSKLLTRNGTNENDLNNYNLNNNKNSNNNFNRILTNFNSNNVNINNNLNSNHKSNVNEQFAFEEVFSEFKVMVQKIKISKDFIFDAKKCEKFNYHSKNNKNFSFQNFNFNVENDWIIRSLKEIYIRINENRISEIRNFNKHLSFLTVFYQFNTENNNKDYSKINKTQNLMIGNNSKNINKNFDDDFIINEKSKKLTKSIADIIDEYFVLFTFRNAFEANFIHNYLQTNKEKFVNQINNSNSFPKKNNIYVENDKEYQFDDDDKINFKNKFINESGNNHFYEMQKGLENKIINPKEKYSSNSNHIFGISNKETNVGLSEKTTNYKYNMNNYDSKDTSLKINSINYKYDSKDNNFNKFRYNENINIINNTEEGNSEVMSVLDIYESNDFFSVNLKLIINLRNSTVISLGQRVINDINFYPLKIKQDENNYILFFETELEREILINYYKEKILNINPIKNYDSHDIISKTKCLEFTKGTHKITKESVEIKKYFKFNIKSEKILKEINSLRDLSMVYKFFIDSKIPKILFFENSEEIFVVYENYENDPIKFIFMNPDLKVTKDISKYSLNIKKMKELKNMLEILSISLSPDLGCDI